MQARKQINFSNGDSYDGYVEFGLPNGLGIYKWADGSSYEGQLLNGLRHGYGYWDDNQSKTYKGSYQNDKKCGYGVFTWSEGVHYEGNFFNDFRQGYGQMIWANGQHYKGNWDVGKRQGQGIIFQDGVVTHDGYFQNDEIIVDQTRQIHSVPNQRGRMLMDKTTKAKTIQSGGMKNRYMMNKSIDESAEIEAHQKRQNSSRGRSSSNFRVRVSNKPFFGPWIPNGVPPQRSTFYSYKFQF